MDCFHEFLKRKNVEDETIECDSVSAIKTISWTETNDNMWAGALPKVEVTFRTLNIINPVLIPHQPHLDLKVTVDEKYGFLLKACIQYEKKKGNLREKSIKEVFFDNLRNERVLKAEVVEHEDMGALTEDGVS